MSQVAADDVSGAIRSLETEGYVVLENAVSADVAAELGASVMNAPQRAPGVTGYEFVVCLLNYDVRFLQLAMHPTVLALAGHLLAGRTEPAPNAFAWPADDQLRLGCVDGLVAHGRSDAGWWHMDSPMGQLNQSRPLPDFPILVNAIWMLSEFSEQTGATRAIPGSQRHRRLPPATQESLDGEVFCCGSPGSVAIIPNTMWHAAGANQTEQPRIGVACNYLPWWVGRLTMDMYPVSREVWETFPPEAQRLTKHQLDWNTDFQGDLTEVSSDKDSNDGSGK
ncbi:MAG: phytanoyl-CoA dioxygenase family protein [Fuerstiella sp.]|nr:phytanoyl-CoA dioxygenase family protein [Fuerstiella sp.]